MAMNKSTKRWAVAFIIVVFLVLMIEWLVK